jgi:hypothetical protein
LETKVAGAQGQLATYSTQVELLDSDRITLGLFALSSNQNQSQTAAKSLKALEDAKKKVGPVLDSANKQVDEKNKEVGNINHKHLLYELAEVLLQIAIVLASVSIIAKRRFMLHGGHAVAAIGVVILIVGYVS